MKLSELNIGQSARIVNVGGEGALRQHFLDMGVIPGVTVTLKKAAPLGDPLQLELYGYALTLRKDDAGKIRVAPLPSGAKDCMKPSPKGKDAAAAPSETRRDDHPGMGEGGRYHDETHEHPLPGDVVLRFALAGNQNCGKTTLFNQLT